MGVLCLGGGISKLYLGDIIVFACAVVFSCQIMCVDLYSERVNGVCLSMIQFLVCGVLSLILMFAFEDVSLKSIVAGIPYVVYLGIMSCGAAYTLQIIGQQYSKNPTVASILMSLESVFAALSGAIIMGERFHINEIIGCVIMFVAIVFSQLPSFSLSEKHISQN